MDINEFSHDEEYEEGEEWIFSYADLMSLMVGFFVIMFLFAGPESEKNKDLAEDIAGSFQKDQETLSAEELVTRNKSFEKLLSLLGVDKGGYSQASENIQKIYAGQVGREEAFSLLSKNFASFDSFWKVYHNSLEPLKIIIPDSLIFEGSDGLSIRSDARQNLRVLARRIGSLQYYSQVSVESHSSSSGTEQSRPLFELTALKASRIAGLLLEDGIPLQKIRVSGQGASDPWKQSKAQPASEIDKLLGSGRIEIWVY